ncbi:general secretion pathway protein D [Acidovorax delafieldii 2AN]|uniref:General secretion pathway protein D n=1 Tax=Acidovorax delafieldii 2AN TaxID=573060 RepID=C5T1E1_ACIDE|nr:general secretion pathway protein D [Acidovorax delafieldii 2AN]
MSFNFEEAPVAEVVRTILGDVLKVDYVLHPPLSGTVTLATRSPMPPDQAVFLLESALQANGLAMMRDARGSYHVGRPEALRNIGGSVRQVGNGPLPPGYGAIVVPLQYIGAAEMATILKPLMPPDAIVRVDNIRNLLVLTGTRTQAEGWLDLINTFDVDLLKGMSVGLFPLKHASIKEVEAALRLVSGAPQASGTGGSSVAASVGVPGTAAASAGASAAALGENSPLFGALRIMPVERLNAVLVVTPRAAYLEEARRWIEKLDQPSDGGAEPQLFIYRVQNGSARHLAGVLSGIFGTGQQTGGYVANSGVAPGLGTSTGTSFGQQQPFGNTGVQGGGFGGSNYATNSLGGNTFGRTATGVGALGTQNRTNQGVATGGVVAANLGGVRVMADEQNNSILVWSTRSDFQKIENTLKRLDLPPTQVLIEASIIEVTLGDDLKYGLQWAFSDTHRGGPGSGLIGALPSASTGGFSYTLKDTLGNMRVTLNALAAKSLIKVISSPSLMVLDNQTATIAVGTQQPIRTGETTNLNTVGNSTTTTYQYKDTGVQLSVQPSVNSGDLVTMDISQAVTDVGDEDTVTGQRAFLQRQISSKVAVRSGEAVVLGGLIKDNSSSGRSGVPLLSSLPVVGGLFGATTSSSGRTELLVVITPKVVRSDPEIRQVSEELRDRLKGLSTIDMSDRAAARPAPAAPALQPLTPP